MSGHGWVTPLPNGAVARCGGPGMCSKCQQEAADLKETARAWTSLTAHRVETITDIELVRQIRNVTAAGFSTHNDYILPEDHQSWWGRTKPLAWLYRLCGEPIVGFGLLRQDDEQRWLTVVAVLPEFAGHGHGKALTHDIVTRCPGRCWATARRDNPAAVKLHVEQDWEIIDGPDARLVYFRGRAAFGCRWLFGSAGLEPAEWPPDGAVEQWTEQGWVLA